jgi:hypothetical protein
MYSRYVYELAKVILVAIFALMLGACTDSVDETQNSLSSIDNQDVLTVWKSPDCACCERWIQHLEAYGFTVNPVNTNNVSQTKVELGVPENLQSCHTAISKSGYVFEGHVPAMLISKFISEASDDVIGLAVAGMPVGSPGMENGAAFTPYSVSQINKNGTFKEYAVIHHPREQE